MYVCTFRHNKRQKLYLSENVHPQTLSVVQTRASDLDLDVIIGPISEVNLASREIAGILIQYPDTFGDVKDFTDIAKTAKKNGVTLDIFLNKQNNKKYNHMLIFI